MLGYYTEIYCDRCEKLEDFYWTIYVKEDIGNGEILESWWEVCKACLLTANEWIQEKRTGIIERRSNKKRVGAFRFKHLLSEKICL